MCCSPATWGVVTARWKLVALPTAGRASVSPKPYVKGGGAEAASAARTGAAGATTATATAATIQATASRHQCAVLVTVFPQVGSSAGWVMSGSVKNPDPQGR